MSLNISNVSKRLKSKQQWICWRIKMRDGKETKLPVDPNTNQMAKTDDPSTWGSVMDAVRAYQSNKQLKGIGFVFTDDDPFVGIDLDDCRDPETEEWEDWALGILKDVDGFREISPSGSGGHIITIGEIPGDRNRKGSIEMYEHTRYFTVTGDIISKGGERTDEVPEIEESQNGINAVYDQFLVDEDSDSATETEVDVDLSGLDHLGLENHGDGPSGTYTNGANLESLPEEEQEIVKTAKGSRNGYKFTQLWRGNWKDVYPGESHSEADMGFCDMLAFWCSGDPERIDRVFRGSGLIRPKWDEQRYSDGSTYGERTIQRAIAKVDDYYDPNHFNEIVDENSDSRENGDNGEGGGAGEENENFEANEGNADGHSDIQDTPQLDDAESDSETTSDKQNTSRQRSRRSRSDSPFLPGSGSKTGGNSETTSSDASQEASEEDSKETLANNDPDEDTGVGEGDSSSSITSEGDSTTGGEADAKSSRRRSRGVQNRIDDSSEFNPVNVGGASESSSIENSETSDENGAGNTPTPVDDSGSFFDREFDDDDFLNEALEDSDEENGLGINRNEAKGIYDDEDDEELTSSPRSRDDTKSASEEEVSYSDETNHSLDSRMSENGKRKIPGVLDAKLRDIITTLDRLGEKVDDLETKHDNEITQQEDRSQILRKELAYYENLVDQQEQKITQLSQVVFLLCRHHSDPFFNQVEQALLDGEEIPMEDIVEIPQQLRDENTTEGGTSSVSKDWIEQSPRSKTRRKRKTSDLDEKEVVDDENSGEDIRDRLSRFF